MNTLIIIATAVVLYLVITKINNRGIAQVNAAAAKTITDSGESLVLDVRTPEEFKRGHIKGARNIPVFDLGQRIASLGSDKNRPVLIYCQSGGRSASAGRILRSNGFAQIANMRGGITAWNGNGLPTVKGN